MTSLTHFELTSKLYDLDILMSQVDDRDIPELAVEYDRLEKQVYIIEGAEHYTALGGSMFAANPDFMPCDQRDYGYTLDADMDLLIIIQATA